MAATDGDDWRRMVAAMGEEWRRVVAANGVDGWHKRALTWKVPLEWPVVMGLRCASAQLFDVIDSR